MQKFKDLFEKFTDIGKLSDEELKKGQAISDPEDIVEVEPDIFYQAIKKIQVNDLMRGDKSKGLDTLMDYDKKDYRKMKCYLGRNNSSGYCLKKGGELVSVFSSQKSSGDALVKSAIKNGAKHLDCYAELRNGKVSGSLYKLYSRHGFKIDKGLTTGEIGTPYSIQNGISRFVNDKEEVEIDNPTVVVFMKR